MIEHKGDKWLVKSESGDKTLGTFSSKEEAEKRLRQIEYFKSHKDEPGLLERLLSGEDPDDDDEEEEDSQEGSDFTGDAILHIDASGPVKSHEITAEGWLKADATLTRTGVFKYKMPDGSIIRQLRLPEEVFSRETMKSMEMLPITEDHPPVGPL